MSDGVNIYRIDNLYLRRLVLVFIAPVFYLILFLMCFFCWFVEGVKGFRIYAKDETEKYNKIFYNFGSDIRKAWKNEK